MTILAIDDVGSRQSTGWRGTVLQLLAGRQRARVQRLTSEDLRSFSPHFRADLVLEADDIAEALRLRSP